MSDSKNQAAQIACASENQKSIENLSEIQKKKPEEEKSKPNKRNPGGKCKYGSKEQVFEGLADQTKGGLCKEDLMVNKKGNIISKKRHEHGKKAFDNIRKKNNLNEEKIEESSAKDNALDNNISESKPLQKIDESDNFDPFEYSESVVKEIEQLGAQPLAKRGRPKKKKDNLDIKRSEHVNQSED